MRETAGQVFIADIKRALEVWRQDFRLPLTSLCVYALVFIPSLLPPENVPGFLSLLAMVLGFLYAGYVGAERIWYLRSWRGKPMPLRDIPRISLSFFGSYLALGFLGSLPLIPLYILFPTTTGSSNVDAIIAHGIAAILLDISLTFATPAIAYTTRDPVEALKINFRTIRTQWPTSIPYVLVPPFAALLLLQRMPTETLATSTEVVLTGLAAVLNLVFKGATAAFYLRFNEVPDDGTYGKRPEMSKPPQTVQ